MNNNINYEFIFFASFGIFCFSFLTFIFQIEPTISLVVVSILSIILDIITSNNLENVNIAEQQMNSNLILLRT